MKRIVLDGLPLQVRSAGIAVYTEALTRAAARSRPDIEFVLFGMSRLARAVLRASPSRRRREPWPHNVRLVESIAYPFAMGYPVPGLPSILPSEVAVGSADVFHATNYVSPRTFATPLVVTVQDLALARFPDLGTRALRRIVERTRRSVEAAERVIAPSQSTRQDLIQLLGTPPGKIRVIAHGVDPCFRPRRDARDSASARQRFAFGRHYLLHVGTLEPRKNLTTLIGAYARLRREHRLEHLLVLTGELGWSYKGIFRLVDDLGLRNEVRMTGRLPASDLPGLYAGADLFVCPSLYEGFGLPVLEAMACGTPVVTSNVSSLPEVAGEAALLIDPRSEAELAEAMIRALTDTSLRKQMRSSGLDQARRFSWERCARETLAVYEEAAGSAGVGR